MAINAKDVQALRQATGAGMMDCKKALEEANGDVEAAKTWLREKGLAASAKRSDRENTQGVVAMLIKDNVGAIVKLKCETDFVASSDQFRAEADTLVALVHASGVDAIASRTAQLDDLKITLKEKIELGEVVRVAAAAGNTIDSYLHIQGGRGVNGVLVDRPGASTERSHDVAVHIALARPQFLTRDEVPAEVVAAKHRIDLHGITVGGGFHSWQRLTSRLVLHGPVTPLVPESLLQTLRTDVWVSESIAQDIEVRWDLGY